MLEAIEYSEELVGRPLNWSYSEINRSGDHIWWISDIRKLQSHYPDWQMSYDIERIIREIHDGLVDRIKKGRAH